ncbi:hypothetical protein [Rhodohalobacter sp.]|uniref:hypothetical protein n=1 Tax=Rhodohalobacter sp. TaxID=1974210 RepID=UPI00356472D3
MSYQTVDSGSVNSWGLITGRFGLHIFNHLQMGQRGLQAAVLSLPLNSLDLRYQDGVVNVSGLFRI